jgi:hypothetical protein
MVLLMRATQTQLDLTLRTNLGERISQALVSRLPLASFYLQPCLDNVYHAPEMGPSALVHIIDELRNFPYLRES